MTLPNLTGLTPADIAEFDALIDRLPHAYAKHLSAWLNEKIVAQVERDRQNLADLEEMCRRIDAERASDTPAARIDAYVDQIAESSCVTPPSPNTLH